MSAITTHILDTARGLPAAGVPVFLDQEVEDAWQPVGSGITDADGRLKSLLSEEQTLVKGLYRLEFRLADYFESTGTAGFYPYVKIVFSVEDASTHYHVPLLLSPFGYSTYRGS